MKILVTGGAGFIGSALVKALVRDGHAVRSLDNHSRGRHDRLAGVLKDVEAIEGDIRNAAAVSMAVKGMDAVHHLACINGTRTFYTRPDLVLDVATRGMLNVLDACLKHGVGDLLLMSSSEVYQTPVRVPTDESAAFSIPDPLNARYSYAGGKIISELLAINYGRKGFDRVTIVRPHNVYGPDMGWEHVIPQFVVRMHPLRNMPDPVPFPIQGDGRETRAFVFIDDFIDGTICVINGGAHLGIYHVGTRDEVPMTDVARHVGDYFGRKITVVPGELAAGSTPRRCPDIARLTALGYRPKIALEDGIRLTAKWYAENIAMAPTGDA